MKKIFLITKREYITRVRNRTFLLTTLLTPLCFILLTVGAAYFGQQRSSPPTLHQVAPADTSEAESSTRKGGTKELAYGIGYTAGILIYLTQLIYGMMVFRGVAEEKNNRIAEIIISSVKPFQLMMGKIVGIGAVGLTQFLLWGILLLYLSASAESFLSQDLVGPVMLTATDINWPLIIGCFLFYFIGGYLFYAALFAAIGSVVDDASNSQSFTLPLIMPIIFSFFLMNAVIQSPHTPLAVWTSIIPFSSPVIMMARIAHGVPGTVPYWELIVSMVTLIAGFLFTTWLSGKIYRTGILLYGKKITWKEMIKWGFH